LQKSAMMTAYLPLFWDQGKTSFVQPAERCTHVDSCLALKLATFIASSSLAVRGKYPGCSAGQVLWKPDVL